MVVKEQSDKQFKMKKKYKMRWKHVWTRYTEQNLFFKKLFLNPRKSNIIDSC